jgi:hypothetical protein
LAINLSAYTVPRLRFSVSWCLLVRFWCDFVAHTQAYNIGLVPTHVQLRVDDLGDIGRRKGPRDAQCVGNATESEERNTELHDRVKIRWERAHWRCCSFVRDFILQSLPHWFFFHNG